MIINASSINSIFTIPSIATGAQNATPGEDPPSWGLINNGIECPADNGEEGIYVREGDALNETLRVRVGHVDADDNFTPMSGVKVVAVMHTAAGIVLPLLFPFSSKNLAEQTGHVFAPPKRLTNAVSTYSDADGVATFPGLGFTVDGLEDQLRGTPVTFPTVHRIAFCTPGQTNDDYTSGCALSCGISVVGRTSIIEWAVQPTVRPMAPPNATSSMRIPWQHIPCHSLRAPLPAHLHRGPLPPMLHLRRTTESRLPSLAGDPLGPHAAPGHWYW